MKTNLCCGESFLVHVNRSFRYVEKNPLLVRQSGNPICCLKSSTALQNLCMLPRVPFPVLIFLFIRQPTSSMAAWGSLKFVGRWGFSKCNLLPLSFNGVCDLNASNGVGGGSQSATYYHFLSKKISHFPSSIAFIYIYKICVVFPSERCILPLLILHVVLKKKQNLHVSKVATCCPIS